MENKKVVSAWVSVVLVTLLVLGMALSIYYIATYPNPFEETGFWVRTIEGIGCVLALVYCFMGYRKNAAVYFTAFCVSCWLTCMMAIFAVAENYQIGFFILDLIMVMHLLIFASLSILIVAKDLGKKKSYVLVGIILLCTVINCTTLIGSSFLIFSGILEDIILKIVLLIIVYAKYRDKEVRGTN